LPLPLVLTVSIAGVAVLTQDGVAMCYCCNTTWRSYSETEDEDGSEAQNVRLQAGYFMTELRHFGCRFLVVFKGKLLFKGIPFADSAKCPLCNSFLVGLSHI